MRPLNDRERRTLRLGAIGLAVYLVVFFGLKIWNAAEKRRTDYRTLLTEAAAWENKLALYDDKVAVSRKLMEQFKFDPAKVARTTLVAQASAALQQAAMRGGIMLGPVRETASRSGGRELTGIQLEATGQVPMLLSFLQSLGTLGFPLVLDSVQLTPGPMGPMPMKANLTLLVLDFDAWKTSEGKPDA